VQWSVRKVAELLNVSEKSVHRWIADDQLPASRVNGQFRINRAELIEWATTHQVHLPPQVFQEPGPRAARLPDLAKALNAGGIFRGLPARDKDSALRSLVERLRLPDAVDRELLLQMLLAREALESTGVGEGVALPHVRNPIVLHVAQPTVTLCFLDHAVAFGALDGRPVHALFTVISPTVQAHLHLLSRLASALRDAEFKRLVQERGSPDAILTAVRRISASLV
jgi:PTS system nitrogen regulatory IIA component